MKILSLAFITFSVSSSVFAESTKLGTIQVLGHHQSENLVEFIPSVTKLSGKELQKKRQTSLGDTIQGEPSVASTSFGPSASRPVIRGLDGERIRILQNSLGTLDASTQSLDHSIPIDTLTIDQIEIVRGPMSLLYGSSAVGGVVNIVTNRTKTKFEEGFSSEVLTQGESVNNGMSNALRADYGKNNWMIHADVSTRNLNNQKIPGFARTESKRMSDPLPNGSTEASKTLPNSYNKQDNQALGVSRIFDKGAVGVSFNHFNTNYGTVAEQNVAINMIQNRWELNSEYMLNHSVFKKVKFKSAQSDYRHQEKDLGVVGTKFTNQGNESRLEVLNSLENIEGVTGIQNQFFNFGALGSEAFLPKSQNQKTALFTFQEYNDGDHRYSVGARIEDIQVDKKASDNFGVQEKKNFTSYNASLGYLYKLGTNDSLTHSFSYTERAPSFQELFSQGPHLATGTYEQGLGTLRKEKAYAVELGYKNQNDRNQFAGNIYAQKFDGYIALIPTGQVDPQDSLPIFNYNQVAANFYGFDLENKNQIYKNELGLWNLITKADFVSAKEAATKNNLPRITPPRFTLGVDYKREKWDVDAELVHVLKQSMVAPNETKTAAYTLTNVGYSYNFMGDRLNLSAFFRLRNLFNVEARNHVSTLKDISPLPGRNAILGLTLSL